MFFGRYNLTWLDVTPTTWPGKVPPKTWTPSLPRLMGSHEPLGMLGKDDKKMELNFRDFFWVGNTTWLFSILLGRFAGEFFWEIHAPCLSGGVCMTVYLMGDLDLNMIGLGISSRQNN